MMKKKVVHKRCDCQVCVVSETPIHPDKIYHIEEKKKPPLRIAVEEAEKNYVNRISQK